MVVGEMNINLAKQLNSRIIKSAKTPHERDLARMRINILKKVNKRLRKNANENISR